MMSGWFKFVQIADGSIPAVFHDKADDIVSTNFKKTVAAAFQANFMGTKRKVEADPQSIHVSEYTYVICLCYTMDINNSLFTTIYI